MEKGFIFSLIFAAIVAVFALNNADKVLIDFLFTKVEISQAIVIFASAILGAVTVSILGLFKNLNFKKEVKELNKKVDSIETERKNLELLLEERGEEIKSLKDKAIIDDTYVEENDTIINK